MVAPSLLAGFREDRRYRCPAGAHLDATLSGDHVLWFEDLPGRGIRFVWDGDPRQPFDELCPMSTGDLVTWSPDGLRVAYCGRRGHRLFVGVDGGEIGEYEDLSRSAPPTFSPDGTRLAFGACVDGSFRLILDGTLQGDRELAPAAAVFSPDGRRIAYVEMEMQPAPRMRLTLDDDPGPWFNGIAGEPRFSPNSRRLAYGARTGDRYQVIVDGVAHPAFARLGWLEFSPDSQRLAYVGVEGDGMSLVVDGKPQSRLKTAARPLFSPNGQHLAYVAAYAEHHVSVVLDDHPGREFEDVVSDSVLFSPDSTRLAYLAKRKGSGFFGRLRTSIVAVVDEQVVGEYEDAGLPVFNPDGRHIAFRGRTGAHACVVKDGETGPVFEAVGDPRFGDNGRVVYVAEQAKRQSVVVDREPLLWVEKVVVPWPDRPHLLDADGDHVAWVAKTGAGFHPVVDRQLGAAYEGVSHPFRDPGGAFGFWAVRGTEVLRLQAVP